MSTKTPSPNKGTDKVELPSNWTRVETSEVARFEHDDGAIVRVRTELPTRSATQCNRAEHTDATGTVTVLYHTDSLPSEGTELHTGGTEQDGVDAAIAFIQDRCPTHDRKLTTDAAGCRFCPACTEVER